jgi:hypothetical protein
MALQCWLIVQQPLQIRNVHLSLMQCAYVVADQIPAEPREIRDPLRREPRFQAIERALKFPD